ncbi:Uncharacterized protein APZ42_020382 [Daphnia magna]|uniref:Uncharacterized protein n=1 Tax=Daphnia magna TaxID=35525 RepID=A0A164XJE6_9CRUS|nr:Uncharacterized protein APZ42_020382 [Daphnia magna]
MYGNETTDESSVTYIQIDRLLNQTVIKAGILSEPRTHKSPTLEYLVLFYIFLVMSILMKDNEPASEQSLTKLATWKIEELVRCLYDVFKTFKQNEFGKTLQIIFLTEIIWLQDVRSILEGHSEDALRISLKHPNDTLGGSQSVSTICFQQNCIRDGIRLEPLVDLIESVLEQTFFETLTQAEDKIVSEGSNKGKVKLIIRLDNPIKYYSYQLITNILFLTRITQPTLSGRDYLFDYNQEDFEKNQHNAANSNFQECKKEALKGKFKPTKGIIFFEINKNKEITVRYMTDIELATRGSRGLQDLVPGRHISLRQRSFQTGNHVSSPSSKNSCRLLQFLLQSGKILLICIHLGKHFHWCSVVKKKFHDLNLFAECNKKVPNTVRDLISTAMSRLSSATKGQLNIVLLVELTAIMRGHVLSANFIPYLNLFSSFLDLPCPLCTRIKIASLQFWRQLPLESFQSQGYDQSNLYFWKLDLTKKSCLPRAIETIQL